MNKEILASGAVATLIDNTEKDRGIVVIDKGLPDNFAATPKLAAVEEYPVTSTHYVKKYKPNKGLNLGSYKYKSKTFKSK